MERHPKLRPCPPCRKACLSRRLPEPEDIPDTVAQAYGAAAEALTIVVKDKLELEATTAMVNPASCCACQNCVRVCPYGAPFFNETKGVSEINEALCKGCGLCASFVLRRRLSRGISRTTRCWRRRSLLEF